MCGDSSKTVFRLFDLFKGGNGKYNERRKKNPPATFQIGLKNILRNYLKLVGCYYFRLEGTQICLSIVWEMLYWRLVLVNDHPKCWRTQPVDPDPHFILHISINLMTSSTF